MTDSFPMGIRCGTCVHGNQNSPEYIAAILPHGFESFQFTFGHCAFDHSLDLKNLGQRSVEALGDSGAIISAIGVYGNPVEDSPAGHAVRQGLEKLIDHAADFGCSMVTGFAGAKDGVSIPDSVPHVAAIWKPLCERAADKGVRLAMENCPMGGSYQSVRCNTSIMPEAWELLFDALPYDNLGLEWEPCHGMCALADPIPQLRQWVDKIFHIQGKDATIAHDLIARHGINGPERWAFHRTPGFGDLDWRLVITILRQHGWSGAIDIEGWHDPVYRGDLEMCGQVEGLRYLQRCRGGDFIPDPSRA